MKKTNNKFRNNNNNNNQIYSLNYRFDSNSIAGKISGTALDLIKRYNDLAKDARGNNDYVSSEIFRQYAEHYRKIVTEINEKRPPKNPMFKKDGEKSNLTQDNNGSNDNIGAGTEVPSTDSEHNNFQEVTPVVEPQPAKKEFMVVELSETADSTISDTDATAEAKPKRTYRRKVAAV